MDGSAKLKVPGGKLVYVRIKYSDNIEDVKILGDFFMHPEEALAQIELAIAGMPARSDEDSIAARISDVARKQGVEMIGVTAQSIAQAIRMAIK